MSQWPTDADMAELRSFAAKGLTTPYAQFPAGSTRDRLRRWGLIERWNPILKVTGRNKPWRITESGRRALQGDKP